MEVGVRMSDAIRVDFCGEEYVPQPGALFVIGRSGDLVIDEENSFLHRQFLTIECHDRLWWLSNTGNRLSATIADEEGSFQGWLAPGAQVPLVFPKLVVWFTAGPSTYDFEIHMETTCFEHSPIRKESDGTVTLGPVALTAEQKLLLVCLCEGLLRDRAAGAARIPQSADLARRLGWPVTKFNRKLDAICEKLADAGVRGLRGGQLGAASSRKARLAEYAMAGRLVSNEDLSLLD